MLSSSYLAQNIGSIRALFRRGSRVQQLGLAWGAVAVLTQGEERAAALRQSEKGEEI